MFRHQQTIYKCNCFNVVDYIIYAFNESSV